MFRIPRPKSLRVFRFGVVRSSLVVAILAAGSYFGQTMPKPENRGDEAVFLSVLRNSEPIKSNSPENVLDALAGLSELSQKKQLKLDETYSELARFIDVENNERQGNLTNLDSHPAMAALYFGGEKVVPILTGILISEAKDSRRSELALWTMLYIEQLDWERVCTLLSEKAKEMTTVTARERLLDAVQKIRALRLPSKLVSPQ